MEHLEFKMSDQTDPIGRMEAQLAHGLSPVQPDPEFVRRLRNRLTNPPGVSIENRPKIPTLLFTLGIITAAILILMGINKLRRLMFR